MKPRPLPIKVAILAFDQVEALDLAGPYEVFTTAGRMHQRKHPDSAVLFDVFCVAQDLAPVRARAGLTLLPSHSFNDAPLPDVLIVPGGVIEDALNSAQILAWITRADRTAQITASVCTGAFLLAASGVISTGEVTTHWEDLGDLAGQFPTLTVKEGVRWVDQGRVVTSAGISAGIDMSLHLVARLTDMALAERTAQQLDFQWTRA